MQFVDLESGKLLQDRVTNITDIFEWAADSKNVLYVKQDPETFRFDRVLRYEIGSNESQLVYEEPDEAFNVYVSKALSERFLYITVESTDESEEYYLDANNPSEAPTLFLTREPKHEYAITDGDDLFYVVTNDAAVNFKVMQTPVGDTSKDNWQVVVPHRENVQIETVTVFRDHIVVEVTDSGLARIETIDRTSNDRRMIEFDETVYTVDGDDNYEYDSKSFRFTYESMTTPPSTFDIKLATHEKTLLREEQVLGGFDKNNYESERVFATASDGTQVPISLVYRKGMKKDGKNPLLQYGYGAYGDTIYPEFDEDVLSLLDRGFIYAIAHIRGGAELGQRWYYDGRGLNKRNTFTDFIDCTRFLIEAGYTSADYVFATGASAGGLTLGAVLNMAPDLYKGVDIDVAFVDAVTTMLDPDIPLTTEEYGEWGNPNVKDEYEYMMSYSPYDNIEKKELLLRTDMGAGHSGKTGRYQPLRETALIYAFFLDLVGIKD
jgi:oligopeptidase B